MSILTTCIILEFGFRVVDGEFRFINFLGEERTLFKSAYPSDFDPLLGWIPQEGVTSVNNVWGKKVTILENGIRSNGTRSGNWSDTSPILAVGDSFTFGDEVSDSETWPAALERLLQRPVINGGVFGYGLDQSFLRAKQLAEIYRPEVLLVGIIADDIGRCELSARTGANKPYFIVQGDQLVLQNVPVPRPSHEAHEGNFRSLLGRSYLVHRQMMKCCPHWWLMGVTWKKFYSARRVHTNGNRVACLLLGELVTMARQTGIKRVLVVIQYTKDLFVQEFERIESLLKYCTPESGMEIVDLGAKLVHIRKTQPDRYEQFFNNHMTAEGNAFVAHQLLSSIDGPSEKDHRTARERNHSETAVIRGVADQLILLR